MADPQSNFSDAAAPVLTHVHCWQPGPAPGRAVLAVDTDRTPEQLQRQLVRARMEQIRLVPMAVSPDTLTLGVTELAPPPSAAGDYVPSAQPRPSSRSGL